MACNNILDVRGRDREGLGLYVDKHNKKWETGLENMFKVRTIKEVLW